MEDNKIIELYEQRDDAAIENTKEKYGAYLNTVAYNILRSHEDSEECVSDSYMKTWNSIPPAKPNCLKAFLAKITRNTALDYIDKASALKRGGGEYALALDELSECISSGGAGSPEDMLEAKELGETINSMLGNLSSEARKIFVLRYFYLYSVSEIAELTGSKPGKISVSLNRSRSVLCKLLEREGY